ncbi:MAG: SpoIIE family protein phosphatase [Candidatus Izemoplasma sp.]|nr:SpoIIE family protein phosphatase [Candidatus Izemoplasma sp.]
MKTTHNNHFIDISVDAVNKYKEELCGDHVEISHNDYSHIVVLSDGLGSGVKANILSTLTSTIASTMLKLGSNIFDVLETLETTLPVCQVRKLAYSTFTIVQIFHDGNVYIIEFDNPKIVYIRDHQRLALDEKKVTFKDKTITEYHTTFQKGDLICLFSDGVIHTGIGKHIDLGWHHKEVVKVLLTESKKQHTAKGITQNIIDICQTFNDYKAGDDTTVVVIKIRDVEPVTLFTGPPDNPDYDKKIINDLVKAPGKKIICGGTAAQIYAKLRNKTIDTNIKDTDSDIPPYAKIDGIDLVTEGIITLYKTIELIEAYQTHNFNPSYLMQNNGASKLANILINHCTHLTVLIGNNANPAHQNPYFPSELSHKWKAINKLSLIKKYI